MILRKLYRVGSLVLIMAGYGEAMAYQTPMPQHKEDFQAEAPLHLVEYDRRWCHHHPERCYLNRPHHWYYKEYAERARHCQHHPYARECERFCEFNPQICPRRY